MCSMKELKDGTYNMYDMEMMHQIIELKEYTPVPSQPAPTTPMY